MSQQVVSWPINTCKDYLCLQSAHQQLKQKTRFSTSETSPEPSMTLKTSPRPSTAIRAMTSLVLLLLLLLNAAMTSALPAAADLLRDVRMAKTSTTTTSQSANPPAEAPPGRMRGLVACPGRHFFSEGMMACKPCSECPINQIIRRPCSALADTVCGPFVEFDTFNQSPSADNAPRQTEDEEERKKGSHVEVTGTDHSPASGSREEVNGRVVSLERANGQWRTLSYALMAVLSFICCVVVVVGFYVCIIIRRSQSHKFIVRGPELLAPRLPYPEADSEPRYVEMFVTSRDGPRTSRHWPVYEEIFTPCDVSQVSPVTSCGCDVRTDEREHLFAYVNTETLNIKDS